MTPEEPLGCAHCGQVVEGHDAVEPGADAPAGTIIMEIREADGLNPPPNSGTTAEFLGAIEDARAAAGPAR